MSKFACAHGLEVDIANLVTCARFNLKAAPVFPILIVQLISFEIGFDDDLWKFAISLGPLVC